MTALRSEGQPFAQDDKHPDQIALPWARKSLPTAFNVMLADFAAPMLLYALTIFVSAFLLFQVQPLIAKMILPWFGGSAAVWSTCLLFFQIGLFAGYLYADSLIQKLQRKTQSRIHVVLLALSLLALPIIPREAWKPAASGDPTFLILGLLAASVGLPYLLLSTTSPLLQAWYARGSIEANPYRLFALSNAGSLLALASYPALVEPFFSTRHQALGWSAAYAIFAVLCATVAFRRHAEAAVSGPAKVISQATPLGTMDSAGPSPGLRLLWLLFAMSGSTFLLAITNHLTQNVAPIPFLWTLPLGLYLLSFILSFRGWYRRDIFLRLLAVALGGMAYGLAPEFVNASLMLLIPLYCAGLFFGCVVCHGELERLKPDPAHLTSFYLMVALGGAAGGVFVALLAPRLFRGFYELPIAIGATAVLVLVALRRDPASPFYRARWQPTWLILVGLVATLITSTIIETRGAAAQARVRVRNFYGSLRVIDLDPIPSDALKDTPVLEGARRKLMNGSIEHGVQFLDPARRRQPTAYYAPRTGVGLALAAAMRKSNLRVGLIGLGAGTIAAYGRPGDHYTFYELNPLVIELARSEFYFLGDSRAEIQIIPGDARLSLERQPPQQFDLLAVDAFSGDSIPVHLLTREAFALYFRHLRPGGVLAVHITNRYLNLRPVLQRAAESSGKRALDVASSADQQAEIYKADWVLLSDRAEFFSDPAIQAAAAPLAGKTRLREWTDDYSNLLGVLK